MTRERRQFTCWLPGYLGTLEAFERLAREAGWLVDRAIERPFTYDVRLAAAL